MKYVLIFYLLTATLKHAAQVPSYVPANNLIGFWLFNNNANDNSGHGNNGTVYGATPATDRFGVVNAAYNYNGTTDYIIVPDNPSLSGFSDMSISVWINTSTFSGIQGIVCKWYQLLNCGNKSDTYEAALSGNQVQFATNYNNILAFSSPSSLSNADLNVWKHLVFINNATGGQSVYINAVLVATEPAHGSICATTNDLYFGSDYDMYVNALHRYFKGRIDDIGLWNRVITPYEIQQLYHAAIECDTAATTTATVKPQDTIPAGVITLPNVITPNGDHVNDYLKFKHLEAFGKNNLSVFNRWGTKVLDKDDYKNDWNGGELVDGTYFFILSLPEVDPTFYKGFFQIIH